MKKNNAVAVSSKNYSITNQSEMVKMANGLEKFILDKKLSTTIQGKEYVHVEGWQSALQSMGLIAMMKEVKDLSTGNNVKWFAEAEIINIRTREVMGRGFALCSKAESKKTSFDEYAIMSMAQTRAIGKAARNLIGWVMKLAGYEGTPSEEMKKVDGTTAPQQTVGKDESPDDIIYCHGARKGGCPDGATVSPAGLSLSMKVYKKPLCRKCFNELKSLKK